MNTLTNIIVAAFLPALTLCLSQTGPDFRIVDGTNANIANYPWQASLRINGNHACGAVLISAERALTAAHCGGSAVSSYSIFAGTTDRTVPSCATCALRDPLRAVSRHPGFINNPSAGYPNDIATVWFYSIAENVNIQYIEMAQESDGGFEFANCAVSGWGRTHPSADLPSTLQAGQMTVITNNECTNIWSVSRIRPEHICAHSETLSLCGGDQGGPLVCSGKLAGVYSWGESQCRPEYPGVFNRVSSFYNWIIETGKEFETEQQPVEDIPIDELMASLFDKNL